LSKWFQQEDFYENFEDGHQAKNRKKGDEILKESSPLKLLSQFQPNFAEMILGWPPSKTVSGISLIGPVVSEEKIFM
jgi:hypothetical protein